MGKKPELLVLSQVGNVNVPFLVLKDCGVTCTSPCSLVSWWRLEFLRDRKLISPQGDPFKFNMFNRKCLHFSEVWVSSYGLYLFPHVTVQA